MDKDVDYSKLIIQLPYLPPTVNHYQKQRISYINGRPIPIRYSTPETIQFKKKTLFLLKRNYSMEIAKFKRMNIHRLSVHITFQSSYRWYTKQGNIKKEDIDNRIKPLLDILVEANIFEDDSRIFELVATKNISNVLDNIENTIIMIKKIS